eukprot:1436327-Prymnesium_polylepis.1
MRTTVDDCGYLADWLCFACGSPRQPPAARVSQAATRALPRLLRGDSRGALPRADDAPRRADPGEPSCSCAALSARLPEYLIVR